MPAQTNDQNKMGVKYCPTCKLEKPVERFYSNKKHIDGYAYQCKDCRKLYRLKNIDKVRRSSITWNSQNKDRVKLINKKYRNIHKERISTKRKEFYILHKDEIKSKKFQKQYGINLEERNSLLNEQGGGCAICGWSECSGYDWAIDHDHKTGKVRGILCNNCNKMLGMAEDSPQVLRNAIAYLEQDSPSPA